MKNALHLVLLLSLVACGESKDTEPADTDTTPQDTETVDSPPSDTDTPPEDTDTTSPDTDADTDMDTDVADTAVDPFADCAALSPAQRRHAGDLTIANDPDAPNPRALITVQGTLDILASQVTSIPENTLTTIRGDLLVEGGVALTQLTMDQLTTVQGALWVETTENLSTLSLPALETLGAELVIDSNVLLSEVSLPALERVNGTIAFNASPALTTIAMPQLTQVGGDGFTFLDLPLLATFPDMPLLTTADELRVLECNSLTQLDGLNALTALETLLLDDNAALTTVGGFGALAQADYVTIHLETAATTTAHQITGFGALPSAFSLEIRSNGVLTLNAFSAVTQLDMFVVRAPQLTSLASLSSLTSVDWLYLNPDALCDTLNPTAASRCATIVGQDTAAWPLWDTGN